MVPSMLTRSHNLKIFKPIIALIPIFMVYDFSIVKTSTQGNRHNIAVLKNPPSAVSHWVVWHYNKQIIPLGLFFHYYTNTDSDGHSTI